MLALRLRLRLPVLVLVPAYKRGEDAGVSSGVFAAELALASCADLI